MNLEIVTRELLSASVEELAQTLRLIADRSQTLHDTVIIDRNGRACYRRSDDDVDPQIPPLAGDPHHHLVEVPAIARPWTTPA